MAVEGHKQVLTSCLLYRDASGIYLQVRGEVRIKDEASAVLLLLDQPVTHTLYSVTPVVRPLQRNLIFELHAKQHIH